MRKISRGVYRFLPLLGLAGFVLLFPTCTSDQLPQPMVADCGMETPTYDVEIRPIIETACAYSGCHLDAASNYSTYDLLLNSLEPPSGMFRVRVFTPQPGFEMPPSNASGPTQLTEEQLHLIECWLDAGYPEN